MTPEEWAVVKDLFSQALALPPSERGAFLERVCSEQPERRREVESLLAHSDGTWSLLDGGLKILAPPSLPLEADSRIGRRIGAYEVLSEIGHGGMGTVYLARRVDGQFDQTVALKVVRRGMDTDAVLARFRHERGILARLHHPYIAQLFDGGVTADDLPYFVMEHIEGKPLLAYCDARILPDAARLQLFRAVCAAVHYAHQNLVVHRDIKPSNILVTEDGTPKLLDFGIAKVLDPEASIGDRTVTALRAMTPDYASPEQLSGEPVTTATDVYSLGVVLQELLTGQRPHRVTSRHDEDAALDVGQPETKKPRIVNREIKGEIENIVRMAMREEPERRYASVAQLAEDIRRFLDGRPVIARKDTIGYRAGKFVRRNRVLVAAVTLVFVSLVGGIGVAVREAAIARAERARAQRRFDDVRKLANTFLFEFHDSIQNLAGSTPARELLVRRGLEYLDSLAREARDDPALQRELAAAYEKVGDVQGGHFGNLGYEAGARKSYLKALATREQLAHVAKADPGYRAALVDCRLKASFVLGPVQAATMAREALAEAQALGQLGPIARAYHRLGQTSVEDGRFDEAFGYYGKEATIYEKRVLADPRDIQSRRGLAVASKYIGALLSQQKKYAESLQSYRKALAIEEAFVAAEPANATYRRDLSFTLSDIGYNLLYQGDKKAALEDYRRAVEIREALAAADPKDVSMARSLASIEYRLGFALAEAGEAGWLAQAQRGLALLDDLVAKNPRSNIDRAWRAEMLSDIGNLFGLGKKPQWRDMNDGPPPPETCAWHRKSLEAFKELRKEGGLSKLQQQKADYVASTVAACEKRPGGR